MRQPTQVEAAEFFEFIGNRGLVVLLLSVHPSHPFNPALLRRFEEEYGSEAAVGTVRLLDLVLSASPALPFLAQGLRACGVSTVLDVLPGYYLFHDGQMLAWESGLPTRGDTPAILRGSLLGALFSAFTRNFSYVAKSLSFAADEAAADRMADRFRRVFAEHRENPRTATAAPSTEDEVLRAYRILGLEPDATDREVNTAWRNLRLEVHPDRAARDPAEFARRSRVSSELNRAREVIRNHRAHARRRARS
jgi:hypothetical protein